MTIIESANSTIQRPEPGLAVDEAQLAAASFLARCSGRTLEAYRHDLRGFFQWATDHEIEVLEATRPHIELFRAWMEEQGLAASTIDRRLSTVCGFYRFAHIDGRISANPAQYVRRPQVHPSDTRGLDRSELGVLLFTAEQYDRDHAALAVLLGLNGLRVSEACATNVEDLGFERGHRVLGIVGKGNKPAKIPLVPRTARTIDLAVGERHEGPILRRRDGQRLDRRTAHRWIRSIGKRAGLGDVHPHMLRAAFIMAALDAGVPLRDVQIAARHADPRTRGVLCCLPSRRCALGSGNRCGPVPVSRPGGPSGAASVPIPFPMSSGGRGSPTRVTTIDGSGQEQTREISSELMKTMTCKQLGGPCRCDHQHQGQTADEVIKAQDRHLKEMVAGGDTARAPALKEMKGRWKHPISGMGWYRAAKQNFAARPED